MGAAVTLPRAFLTGMISVLSYREGLIRSKKTVRASSHERICR